MTGARSVTEAGFRSDVPGASGPARRPGSVRRTSTIDITAVLGPQRRLRLEGSGRDLLTTASAGIVLDRATMSAVVDLRSRTLTQLTVTPARWQEPLQALVGQPAQSGFRGALARTVPGLTGSGGLLPLLLDDLPVCILISGQLSGGAAEDGDGRPRHPPADVCAGWQAGGRLLTLAERGGRSPLVVGPCSGELVDPDDPLGWHDVPRLGEVSMRRARRLDVLVEPDGRVRAGAYLRDVRRSAEPAPRTVHEYSARVMLDGAGTVRQVEAVPHVLPAPECPQAVASAGRLVGLRVDELREVVNARFTGVSTCTHLNDVLRSLGDTGHLAEAARRGEAGGR